MIAAAVYARKSTEQLSTDADAKSVARQIENARAFAASKGWSVPDDHVYADDAISGAEVKKLRNRQRLLDVINTSPPFKVLIMRDASRFSRRDGDEAFAELKAIARAGVEVWYYSDGQPFRFGDMGSNVVGFVRAEMNAEYRRQIARWTREAMVRKAQAGHVAGGRCFGYDNVRVDGHVERRINDAEAVVVRRIFDLSAAGMGYTNIAKLLNDEQALAPRPQQGRRACWGSSSVYEVLHRPLYRGEVVWNKTKKRDAEGKAAVQPRPESEWLRRQQPELRIVADELWERVHQRLGTARATYERQTHGRRQYHRDEDSKYLLTGFARCAGCGGGLHVRTRRQNSRGARAFFYACTNHFNKGATVCAHAVQWPMLELDHEVIATLTDEVLTPEVVAEVIEAARTMHAAIAQPERPTQLRRELATIERELSRLTDAVAGGAGAIPVLVERMQQAETKRRAVVAELQQVRQRRPAPVWRDIEKRLRTTFADWQARLRKDVAGARELLRQALTGPIRFTPAVERGYHVIRFEGRVCLRAAFGEDVVMNLASLTGNQIDYTPVFQGIWRSDRRAA